MINLMKIKNREMNKKTIIFIFLLSIFGCATTQNKDLKMEDKNHKKVKTCSRRIGPIPLPPWGNLVKKATQKSEKAGIQSVKKVFFTRLAFFTLFSRIVMNEKTEGELDLGKISILNVYVQMKKKANSLEKLNLKSNISFAIYSQSCLVILGE